MQARGLTASDGTDRELRQFTMKSTKQSTCHLARTMNSMKIPAFVRSKFEKRLVGKKFISLSETMFQEFQ